VKELVTILELSAASSPNPLQRDKNTATQIVAEISSIVGEVTAMLASCKDEQQDWTPFARPFAAAQATIREALAPPNTP
jgi:predicted secreted protein